MKQTVLLLASTALAVLLLALAVGERPASAAYPGKNGRIAFVSTRDGNEEIYAMDADGTDQTRLTTEPGRDVHPAYDPGGKRLTFTRRPLSGVVDETIYLMDARDVDPEDGNGDNVVKLTPAPNPNFQSAFSPDGQRLVFVRQEGGGDADIYMMDADGTDPVQITDNAVNDFEPAFSPDGARIVYTRSEPGSPEPSRRRPDVYVMNADGTGQTRLTSTPAADNNPSFSPDGAKVAFQSARDGNAEIYVMNPDGTAQTNLTKNQSTDEFPAYSPDGRHLAFSSDRDDNGDGRNDNLEVYIVGLGSDADPVPLTVTEPPVENTRADWGRFTYDFDGFHEPVDNPPTTNKAKAGRAIPVKFGLGGDQGLGILAPEYPRSQQIDCDSAAPLGESEQTASAGESGLAYDAATGEYTYVWKTSKAWEGTCRQLAVKLDDGTVHRATFAFK